MTTTIATLRPTETVTFDHGKLARLCDRMGAQAEGFIAGVLADVETLVDAIGLDRKDAARLSQHCTELAHYADLIGMITLVRAAKAVMGCIDGDDTRATAACIDRLIRLGRPQDTANWAMASASRPDTVA